MDALASKEIRNFYVKNIDSLGNAMPFRAYSVLVVKNLESGKERKIELRDLVDEQTFSYVKGLDDDRTPPSLYLKVDKDSVVLEGKSVRGRVDLFTSGDPPVSFVGNDFEINTENWEIRTYFGGL